MRKQGITPETEEWDRRWANYILGHGATYDMQTGNLIAKKDQIVEPLAALKTAIKDAQEGRFKPDRANDELTNALGNPEHGGRVRGFGPSVSWKYGFSVHKKVAKMPKLIEAEREQGSGRSSWTRQSSRL